MYRRVREASVGEELSCQRERGNLVDPLAIAVLKNGDVVGQYREKSRQSVVPSYEAEHNLSSYILGVPGTQQICLREGWM